MDYTMTPPSEASAQNVTLTGIAVTTYAGFWKRFLASFLDGLVGGLGYVVIMLLLMAVGGGFGHYEGNQPAAVFFVVLLWIFLLFGSWLYPALMESSKLQATVGKLAVGLKVTDLEGRRISFGRATARYFAHYLSVMTLLIGYIMAAFTQKKQAMHDMVAGTLVLEQRASVPANVAHNAFAS